MSPGRCEIFVISLILIGFSCEPKKASHIAGVHFLSIVPSDLEFVAYPGEPIDFDTSKIAIVPINEISAIHGLHGEPAKLDTNDLLNIE